MSRTSPDSSCQTVPVEIKQVVVVDKLFIADNSIAKDNVPFAGNKASNCCRIGVVFDPDVKAVGARIVLEYGVCK